MRQRIQHILRWALTLACAVLLTVYQAAHRTETHEAPAILVPATGLYADGVYTGEAEGYGGMIALDVTIQDGLITEVRVTEASGEDKPYLRDAKTIIRKVIAHQHTDWDAVAGATTTTWGILDAIDAALEEATQ